MKPTVNDCLEALKVAADELNALDQQVREAQTAMEELKKKLDLAKRRRLNVEQELKQAIRNAVGSAGDLF